MNTRIFSVVDYVIFALMLAVSTFIGVFYAVKDRNHQNTEEYLLAGRSMSAYPVAFSLSVSFMSAILVLGTPSEVYLYGTLFIWSLLSHVVVSITTAEIYIPVFYNMGLKSVYEYLGERFNRVIRIEGTLLYMTQTLLYLGIVIYAPALALNAVTGFDLWPAVASTGFICILYSSLGGLKAVIWTDTIQAVVMVTGFVSIIIQGGLLQVGLGEVWKRCEEGGRIELWKWSLDPRVRHTPMNITVGFGFIFMSLYAVNQGQVQRYLSCRTLREAKKSILLNTVGLWILNIFAVACGLILYSYYHDCDPFSNGNVARMDQLLPYLVMDIFQHHPGMPGLFIACVYSGSLSTVSTGITALASVAVEDFLKPVSRWKDKSYTWASRALVVIFGGVAIVMAYLTSQLGALLQTAASVIGLVGGPLLGLYTLGVLFPFVNSWGAFIGANSALAAVLWVFVESRSPTITSAPLKQASPMITSATINFTSGSSAASLFDSTPETPGPGIYAMSYTLYSPFGCLWTVAVGIAVSLATGGWKTRNSVKPQLIYPFFDHWFFSCFPEKIRRALRCGNGMEEEDLEKKTQSENAGVTLPML